MQQSSRFLDTIPELECTTLRQEDHIHHDTITIRLGRDDRCSNDLGLMLQNAIERSTNTPWRSVSPTVAVERVEPYRALVIRGDNLRQVEGWRMGADCESTSSVINRQEITITLQPIITLGL